MNASTFIGMDQKLPYLDIEGEGDNASYLQQPTKAKVKELKSFPKLINQLILDTKIDAKDKLATDELVLVKKCMDRVYTRLEGKLDHLYIKIIFKFLSIFNSKYKNYRFDAIKAQYQTLYHSLLLKQIKYSNELAVKDLLASKCVASNFDLSDALASARDISQELVIILLKDARLLASAGNQTDFINAIKSGDLDLVQKLLKNENIDPSASKNEALREAKTHNHLEIAKALLENEQVKNCAHNLLETFNWAIEKNHSEIVDALLKNECIDLSADQNAALRLARGKNRLDIAKALLKNEQVKNCAPQLKETFKWAIEEGHLEIVETLLENNRIDPSADQNAALLLARAKNRLDIAKALLKNEQVKNCAPQLKETFKWAIKEGHLEIVETLLENNRIDPSADQNAALLLARAKNRLDIAKALLKNEQVKNCAPQLKETFKWAIKEGNLEIVDALLENKKLTLLKIEKKEIIDLAKDKPAIFAALSKNERFSQQH